jgi:rod shape-determining protein MreD
MAVRIDLARLFGTALMLAMGIAALFLEAAPLGLAADARPSPDLVFLVVAYWSLRRPEAAGLLAVFALGLARDLLTDTPPGLGALSLVLASEYLKAMGPVLARWRFVAEWFIVVMALALALALQWLTVLLLLAHPPYLSDLGLQWLASVALYPVLALVLRWLFRIGWRKPEPA